MTIKITNLIFYLLYSFFFSMLAYYLVKLFEEKSNKKSKIAKFVMKYPWLLVLILWITFILYDLSTSM